MPRKPKEIPPAAARAGLSRQTPLVLLSILVAPLIISTPIIWSSLSHETGSPDELDAAKNACQTITSPKESQRSICDFVTNSRDERQRVKAAFEAFKVKAPFYVPYQTTLAELIFRPEPPFETARDAVLKDIATNRLKPTDYFEVERECHIVAKSSDGATCSSECSTEFGTNRDSCIKKYRAK